MSGLSSKWLEEQKERWDLLLNGHNRADTKIDNQLCSDVLSLINEVGNLQASLYGWAEEDHAEWCCHKELGCCCCGHDKAKL